MNISQEDMLGGEVVEERGSGHVFQELVGGPCRFCGRTRRKTVFCEVCGALVCKDCLSQTACDVRSPEGYSWSHGRAMRVHREERDRSWVAKVVEIAGGVVAPSPAPLEVPRGAAGADGKDGDVVSDPQPLDDAKWLLALAAERERLLELGGESGPGPPA